MTLSSHISKPPQDEFLSNSSPSTLSSRVSKTSRRSFPSLHTLATEPFSSAQEESSEKKGKRALEPTLLKSNHHGSSSATASTLRYEPGQEDLNQFIFDVPSLKNAIATLEQHESSFEAHHVESVDRLFRSKFTIHTYSQWYLHILSGYHLIFYGYGAKERAISRWLSWTQMTAKYRILVLDGCNESLSLELVCHRLAKAIGFMPSIKRKADRVEELLEALDKEKLVEGWKPWLFVVHHLDGPLARSDTFQSFFHRLAQKKELVSFVCTIEHIHACLLFSSNYFPPHRSRTLFVDCTTMTRYSMHCLQTALNVSGAAGSGTARGGHLGSISASAAITVLSNLTSHARKVYALLANWQLGWDRDETELQQPPNRFGTPIKNSVPLLASLVASPGMVPSLSTASMLSPKSPATAAYVTGLHHPPTLDSSIGLTFEQLYQMARESFLATHESTFRALVNEFTDHALIVIRRSTSSTTLTTNPSTLPTLASSSVETALEPPTERLSSPLPFAALRSVLTAIEQLQ